MSICPGPSIVRWFVPEFTLIVAPVSPRPSPSKWAGWPTTVARASGPLALIRSNRLPRISTGCLPGCEVCVSSSCTLSSIVRSVSAGSACPYNTRARSRRPLTSKCCWTVGGNRWTSDPLDDAPPSGPMSGEPPIPAGRREDAAAKRSSLAPGPWPPASFSNHTSNSSTLPEICDEPKQTSSLAVSPCGWRSNFLPPLGDGVSVSQKKTRCAWSCPTPGDFSSTPPLNEISLY